MSKARFSKAQILLGPGKPKQKSPESCFTHIFLIWTEVPFKQEVLGT